MKLIDVSVPLDAELPTYPHNTPFTLEPIKRLARGDSSNVSTLHMSAHCGTHADAPSHVKPGARAIGDMPLAAYFGPAKVIALPATFPLTCSVLGEVERAISPLNVALD